MRFAKRSCLIDFANTVLKQTQVFCVALISSRSPVTCQTFILPTIVVDHGISNRLSHFISRTKSITVWAPIAVYLMITIPVLYSIKSSPVASMIKILFESTSFFTVPVATTVPKDPSEGFMKKNSKLQSCLPSDETREHDPCRAPSTWFSKRPSSLAWFA